MSLSKSSDKSCDKTSDKTSDKSSDKSRIHISQIKASTGNQTGKYRDRTIPSATSDSSKSSYAGEASIHTSRSGLVSANSRNPLLVLRQIWIEEGAAGLLAGTAPRALRALVSGAVQFATYEVTQNLLTMQQQHQ